MASVKKMDPVFPDLHHKMSKKIAMLTKVIYHLNTKNEDHQLELENVTSNHQAEIQQILKDASSRIAKFKEVLENQKASVNQDAKLEKLQKKHDLEKQQAMLELQALKKKMVEKEANLSNDYKQKFDGLKAQIENMNKQFQEKIEKFETTNKNLRAAVDAAKNDNTAAEAQRKLHEAELADLLQKAEEK